MRSFLLIGIIVVTLSGCGQSGFDRQDIGQISANEPGFTAENNEGTIPPRNLAAEAEKNQKQIAFDAPDIGAGRSPNDAAEIDVKPAGDLGANLDPSLGPPEFEIVTDVADQAEPGEDTYLDAAEFKKPAETRKSETDKVQLLFFDGDFY